MRPPNLAVRFPLARRAPSPVTIVTCCEDFERCYRAVQGKDARFDGWFFTGVTSTGIYCRPSCPAITPKRANVRFYPTAAAAQLAGFRACKRCRPDATPGSPEWNVRADVVGRAMRLIADGVVDRDGVRGLAARLGYSERHLHRQLDGRGRRRARSRWPGPSGPRPHASSSRRRTCPSRRSPSAPASPASASSTTPSARCSPSTPTELRAKARPSARHRSGPPSSAHGAGHACALRLAVRQPFDGDGLLAFLGPRAVPGIEELVGGTYRRTLRLPHGPAVVELTPAPDHVRCRCGSTTSAIWPARSSGRRRLLDLDADPTGRQRPARRPTRSWRRSWPSHRAGGRPDTSTGPSWPCEPSSASRCRSSAARTHTARLVAAVGTPLTAPDGGLTHLFPAPAAVADADPAVLAMPASRRRAHPRAGRGGSTTAIDHHRRRHRPGAPRAPARPRCPGSARGPRPTSPCGGWATRTCSFPAISACARALERLGIPADPRLGRRPGARPGVPGVRTPSTTCGPASPEPGLDPAIRSTKELDHDHLRHRHRPQPRRPAHACSARTAGLRAVLWPTDAPGERVPWPDATRRRAADIRSCGWPPNSSTSTSPAGGASFEVPLDLHGTPFQVKAWRAPRHRPVRLHGQLPAAGVAPRRREQGPRRRRRQRPEPGEHHPSLPPGDRLRSGALTGFAGGLDAKRSLLEFEARVVKDGTDTVPRVTGTRRRRVAIDLSPLRVSPRFRILFLGHFVAQMGAQADGHRRRLAGQGAHRLAGRRRAHRGGRARPDGVPVAVRRRPGRCRRPPQGAVHLRHRPARGRRRPAAQRASGPTEPPRRLRARRAR